MKRLKYIFSVVFVLLFFSAQHKAWGQSDVYRNDTLAYLHYVFQRDSVTRAVLDAYESALHAGDNEALLNSYIRLSELSVERGDYQKARDYAYKAIMTNNLLPERRSMSHVYLNIYKAQEEGQPYDSSRFSILRKAMTLATTDDERFEVYIYMAVYYAQQRDVERYSFWRNLYGSLADDNRKRVYADIFWRAESFRYALNAKVDSAAIMCQRIQTPQLRYNALLSLYRENGQFSKAMHYADSVDNLMRREAALSGTFVTAYLQAAIERSSLEHTGYLEQMQIASSMAEINQNRLLHEQMQLEAERASNEARQIEMAGEERRRSFQLEQARHQQQQLQAENQETEHQAALIDKRESVARLIIVAIIIVGMILFIMLAYFFVWVRTKARATDNMRRMNEEEDILRNTAVEASASRDRFIRDMTSEMQQSLGEVSNYAQILADVDNKLSEEERNEYGEKVLNCSIRVVDHINSILNPNEYMPQADRASEEARIERARRKYSQGMAVMIILLFISSVALSHHHASYTSIYDTGYGLPYRRNTVDSGVMMCIDQAYRVRFDKEQLSQKVLHGVTVASKIDEHYGHCMLLSIPVIADYATGSWEEFEQSCETLRTFAKKYGYTQYYYYTFLKEVERGLRDNNMFRAMTVLENMEREAESANSQYGKFYAGIARMMVSKKREDPIGVIKWAHLALEIGKGITDEIDLSSIYIEIFHHTHGARRTSYGDSLLRCAVKTAKSIVNIAHSNLERAYFCAVNDKPADYYRHIAVYDSLNAIYNINSSYEILIKAYRFVMEDDVDSALAVMNTMPDRFESYKYQLALASRHKRYEYAMEIRDSLLRMRKNNEYQLMENDIAAISELNGTDSLRRVVAEKHETALQLQAQQKAMAVRKHRMAIEKERQDMRLRKLADDNARRASEMELHATNIATNKLKLQAQATKARMESDQASHEHMMLLITVGTLSILAMVVLLFVIYIWRRRTAILYTQLEQKNRALNIARVEAEQAIERKERFIQNMSHELRTPLNAITGFSQLLALPADSFSDEERQRFAQHVEHNINLLTMLVDDIVDIGSVERGSYKIVCSETSVNDILRQALGTVEYRVPADVAMKLNTELPDTFTSYTDGRRILQVLVNYLTNAIKHTVEGTITLSVERFLDDKNIPMLRFAVADTGAGVPPSQHENIFSRFVKLEKFVQGTGLGLSICRIIAEKMQGRCYLDTTYPASSPDTDHGARFVFELPVVVNNNA